MGASFDNLQVQIQLALEQINTLNNSLNQFKKWKNQFKIQVTDQLKYPESFEATRNPEIGMYETYSDKAPCKVSLSICLTTSMISL